VHLTKLVRTYTAALVVSLSLVAPAAAAGPSGTGTDSSAALSKIRIDNFGRVDAHYYRGAQPEGQDYADLAAAGVKTLINLTSDDAQANEKSMASSAGLAYFQIPMTTHQPPTGAQLAEFFRIVDDPANQPVYVHCVGGRHRTGVMTAAYRMTEDRWTADQAFQEMKQYKFGADFLHSEFKDFVYSYRPVVAAPAVAAPAVAAPAVAAPAVAAPAVAAPAVAAPAVAAPATKIAAPDKSSGSLTEGGRPQAKAGELTVGPKRAADIRARFKTRTGKHTRAVRIA
jgi:tyrosine-protein phosphatase SIW14